MVARMCEQTRVVAGSTSQISKSMGSTAGLDPRYIDTYEEWIYQWNERATTNLRPRKDCSRRGESRSAWFSFVLSIIDLFKHLSEYRPNKNGPSRIEFASSNPPVPRSQILLKCHGSIVNWCFSFFKWRQAGVLVLGNRVLVCTNDT